MNSMPCEEFKRKIPLKHEWRVTLKDMVANNWTLVYPSEDRIGPSFDTSLQLVSKVIINGYPAAAG